MSQTVSVKPDGTLYWYGANSDSMSFPSLNASSGAVGYDFRYYDYIYVPNFQTYSRTKNTQDITFTAQRRTGITGAFVLLFSAYTSTNLTGKTKVYAQYKVESVTGSIKLRTGIFSQNPSGLDYYTAHSGMDVSNRNSSGYYVSEIDINLSGTYYIACGIDEYTDNSSEATVKLVGLWVE